MFVTFDTLMSAAATVAAIDRDEVEPASWQNDHGCEIRVLPNWLSATELDNVRHLQDKLVWTQGKLANASRDARSSACAWIGADGDTLWLYRRLAQTFTQVNIKYRFDLRGLNEEPQLLRYGTNDHIDWHHDLGVRGASVRKLALIALVERCPDCAGGYLEFSGVPELNQMNIPGCAIVFPPFMAHRVTRLSRGSRLSLAAWACGPSFK